MRHKKCVEIAILVPSGECNNIFITGKTIVWPSDYILRLVFLFLFRSRSRSSHRPIPPSDIPNSSEWLWYKTTLSDFHYVISGLNGEPKSASFFAF